MQGILVMNGLYTVNTRFSVTSSWTFNITCKSGFFEQISLIIFCGL